MSSLKITDANKRWYEIIIWWETRRIPYNVVMYFVGYLSFYICFVTIPLVYLVIGITLNIFYTFGWIIELLFINRGQNENRKLKYSKFTFVFYLISSSLFVLGIAVLLLLRI